MNLTESNNIWVVMPAYNAAETLKKTFMDLPFQLRKNVILVDDCSTDQTVAIARSLDIIVICHEKNMGYGANQKTCYREALRRDADVVIMIHPDYQYDSRVAQVMADLIQLGNCDLLLGNRIRNRADALGGGMPRWKYYLNRISTFVENFVLGQAIGDFHSGLRAYSRETLNKIPFGENSDDFAFDQEMLIQAVAYKLIIGDIPVPVRYFSDSSSINFRRSVEYGMSALKGILSFWLHRFNVKSDPRFQGS